MDGIFKKSSNIFNVVSVSINEPYRYDKNGKLKQEYLEEGMRRRSVRSIDAGENNEEKQDKSPASSD